MNLWARFRTHEARTGFGVVDGGSIREYAGDMFGAAQPTGATHEPGSFVLESPCLPTKIIGLWNNFHALAAKLGKRAPAHPLYFIKPSTSVIGPDAPIRRPAGYTGKIVFEGELGIVIQHRCSGLDLKAAAAAIFGYTCVNDVTAIDVLSETPDFAQWCRSKSYDTFGCLGPLIARSLDTARARLITALDGVERQNYALSDMIFSPAELVSRISHDMTLLPGDVIACGTSLGVGSLREGAAVEVRIEGIGSLRNVLSER